MVIGLLAIAGIPTTIAICEGISEKNKPKDTKKEDQLLRKFTLSCWCDGKSPGKRDIHGGKIVIGDGKVYLGLRESARCHRPAANVFVPQMWIQSPKAKPRRRLHVFEGFYIEYPDDERPPPAPMGMVTKVEDDPPLMNWIYIDRFTSEVKHGNRSTSRNHWVGDWGNTNQDSDGVEEDDAEDAGGIDLDDEEKFVAVQPEPGDTEGRWEVYWDQNDDRLGDGQEVEGRRVLRISLERKFLKEGT